MLTNGMGRIRSIASQSPVEHPRAKRMSARPTVA